MPYKPKEREYRSMVVNTAPADGREKRFDTDYYAEGYCTTYNQPYLMFHMDGVDYYEVIDARALDGADLTDIIMQYDHDGRVLAAQRNNTLIFEPHDPHGPFVAMDMGRSDQAKAIHGDINAGLITGMSWSFVVADGGDTYDPATHTRTITKIRKVYDVSAVSYPTNPNTEISARSYCERRAAEAQQEIAAALAKHERTKAECLALLSL